MKKYLSIVIICCLVSVTGLFSSCGVHEDGDWIFSIQLDPSNETEADRNSFEAFINPTMTEVMKASADRYTESSNTFIFNGEKSEVLKRAENAFVKGTTQIESSGHMEPIDNIKINLCRTNRDTNQDEVVKSHTFKN
ncbi:MAG: hypothetical protein K5846_06070 [Bacteroidales bacterium]|nr:hypothetical protein [Bacteroidales bacterium]